MAIFSQYPLKQISYTELQPVAGLFENRVVLHATVETPHGDIDLFVTHLTSSKASVNAAQVESLLAFVQTEATHPAIIAGDFNAVESSPQMIRLAEIWHDSYRLAHPHEPGQRAAFRIWLTPPPQSCKNGSITYFSRQPAKMW